MRHTLLNPEQAAQCLRAGQVIAYPTEAVFGLGCDPRNESALKNLLALKHRPAAAGLILIGSHFDQFSAWVAPVSGALLKRADETWPGPVTWLFPRAEGVSDLIAGEHNTIAIRVSAHEPVIKLCNAFGGPLVSTSANPSTATPARSAGKVEDYFGNLIGGILDGPLGGVEKPSEIRDLVTGKVLRGV
jgi:L-threonylcarbamoyladenylate synthase